jgi:hypothetical protein
VYCGVYSQRVQLYTGAQINFGDLTGSNFILTYALLGIAGRLAYQYDWRGFVGPKKKTIVAKEEWWRPEANANVTRLRKSPKLSERGCEESANDVGRWDMW